MLNAIEMSTRAPNRLTLANRVYLDERTCNAYRTYVLIQQRTTKIHPLQSPQSNAVNNKSFLIH